MKTQAGMMRTLILGVVALLIVLVGAAFVTNAGEESMGERANALTLDALPSIEHLTEACDALRDLEAHADDYAGLPAETQATGRVVLDDDWRRIDRELSDYLALPAFGGERALYESTIPSALRILDEAVSRLTAAMESQGEELSRVSWQRLSNQEAAARRFSHELHDELGQELTAIKTNLTALEANGQVNPARLDDLK